MGRGGGDAGPIEEGSAQDFMPQLGTFATVPELEGRNIRIPAYIVPIEFSDDHFYKEFLLVPYMGACIHTPPPPPNQIIYVKTDKPVRIDDIWAPVYADGILKTQKHENDVGNAAYTMALSKLEPYKF